MPAQSDQQDNRSAELQSRASLHVIFVVDCSGSMCGDKIASLNYAMRSALPALRAAAAAHPANDTFVRVMRFADVADWTEPGHVPVAIFEWRELSAGGETSLGAALEGVASALTAEAMPGRQLPPVIILASDGLPTDDVDAGIARLEASAHGGNAIRLAIAIGSDANLPSLQKFIGGSNLRPLRANSAETLVNQIRWAASEPVVASQISHDDRASPGALSDHLSSGIADQNQSDTSFVW